MNCVDPPENYPLIETVENPAFFFDGSDLILCYEVAPASGGGNAIIRFEDVDEFNHDGWANVRALENPEHMARPWQFSEIEGSSKANPNILRRRHWTISFNDVLLSIVFSKTELKEHLSEQISPKKALAHFIKSH